MKKPFIINALEFILTSLIYIYWVFFWGIIHYVMKRDNANYKIKFTYIRNYEYN